MKEPNVVGRVEFGPIVPHPLMNPLAGVPLGGMPTHRPCERCGQPVPVNAIGCACMATLGAPVQEPQSAKCGRGEHEAESAIVGFSATSLMMAVCKHCRCVYVQR